MINFFVENFDSFIISTIFLILGFLPTIFDSNKAKNKDISFENTNINNSNVGNTYNQNIYNQNHAENHYNTRTTVINHNPTTTDDDFSGIFIISIMLIIPLILFYKHINKILVYSITITASCLILSLLMYRNLIKVSNYIPIPNNILNISIRNIICWILVFTNYITIFYRVNFSSVIKPFLDLITDLNTSTKVDATSKVFRFLLDNPYEGSTAIFIIISFLLSIFLITQLFLSYIWITSSTKVLINPNSKFWPKISNSLNKKESNLNGSYWTWLFILLFGLSTGAISYLLNLPTKLYGPHKL